MVIRHSSAGEIRRLLDRLLGGDPVHREAAAARLAVLGARTVPAMVGALDREPPVAACVALLRTLEAIEDPRALGPAARLVDDRDPAVAAAAVAVLRVMLRAADHAASDAAFERLSGLALDATRSEPVRALALEALSDLAPDAVAQVMRELEQDPSPIIRGAARRPTQIDQQPGGLAELAAAAQCPEPEALRARLAAEGPEMPLSVLARVLDAFREREAAESAAPRRTEWQAARAAVHQALAARGSRLGLVDLRDSLAGVPGPLPVGFVAALERVGDASCLDAVAAAYLRAKHAADPWWTEHLLSAFRGILRRERLTRRSPAVRHVMAKWPEAAADLLPARR